MVKRITLKQVAEELDISMMTVSRALNGSPNVDKATKAKVIKTARRLGYSPNHIAKSLVQRRTQTIGVVIPEIAHSFFPEAIRGIEEAAYDAGYQIMLTHSAESGEREYSAIQTLASKRVDGILISVAQSDTDTSVYRQAMKLGLHLVFFDRCVHGIGASCIGINDEESAIEITEHLLGHKYRKIAHLSGPANISIGKARLKGFKKAFEKKRIPFDDELIVESGFHENGGYDAMKKLLALPVKRRPRAVFAVNDPAAFGAMKAIIEAGLKIPEDIAIAGISDDVRAELMMPALTTMRQPAYEVGKTACRKLIAHIENKKERSEEIILTANLVVRKSCGCN